MEQVRPQSMAALLKALEHAGWVIRCAAPLDRRRVTISLAAAGRSVLNELAGRRVERLDRALAAAHVTPRAFDEAVQLVQRVVERLDETPSAQSAPAGAAARSSAASDADLDGGEDTTRTSGEVAGGFGMRSSALRHYESLGLLEPDRAAGGRRLYRRIQLRRLALIRAYTRTGMLSLSTVAELLEADGRHRGARKLLEHKLDELALHPLASSRNDAP